MASDAADATEAPPAAPPAAFVPPPPPPPSPGKLLASPSNADAVLPARVDTSVGEPSVPLPPLPTPTTPDPPAPPWPGNTYKASGSDEAWNSADATAPLMPPPPPPR